MSRADLLHLIIIGVAALIISACADQTLRRPGPRPSFHPVSTVAPSGKFIRVFPESMR